MPPVKWGHARDFGGEPWKRAFQTEDHFAKKRFAPPQLSSFARLCSALFLCTGLAIAPLPAAAFGGFGSGGGWGPPGFMQRGQGGKALLSCRLRKCHPGNGDRMGGRH